MRQHRQSIGLLSAQWPDGLIAGKQRHALGHIKRPIFLKAPGIEEDRHVVDQKIIAGEIEIYETGKLLPKEKHIIGKGIGMNHTRRQACWPSGFQQCQIRLDFRVQICLDFIGP